MTTNVFNQARGLAGLQQSGQPDVKIRRASQEFRRTPGQAGSNPIEASSGAFSPVTWPPMFGNDLRDGTDDVASQYGSLLVVRDFRHVHIKVKPDVEAQYIVYGYMSVHDTTPDTLGSLIVAADVLTKIADIDVSSYAYMRVERRATGGTPGQDEILGLMRG